MRWGSALVLAMGLSTSALGLSLPALAQPLDAVPLVEQAIASGGAYERAVRLADQVGARLAGSPAAARAVTWAEREMKALGLSNVHTEPVTVEAWSRGEFDRVELEGPYARPLRALALGRSPGTPKEGISAEVVEVRSFDELRRLGERARGKIVFYNRAMKRPGSFEQYGSIGDLRFEGAVHAARAGAVGAVVRSIGTGAHRLPHTGATSYDEQLVKLPFAALAAEDAELLHRALLRGPARLTLKLGCGMRGKVESANVVGEIRGRELPDQIVLVGAHLDSWDVGDGALDDGVGVGIVLETLRLLKAHPPRRTVRVVLFMNEEYGLSGAKAYAQAHAAELVHHVAAMEADAGGGLPLGFVVRGDEASLGLVRRLAQPLASHGAGTVSAADETGADLIPMAAAGVPAVGMRQDGSDYFEWHHTDGDTADKIDPVQLGKASGVFAAMAFSLAESPEVLPRDVRPRDPRLHLVKPATPGRVEPAPAAPRR